MAPDSPTITVAEVAALLGVAKPTLLDRIGRMRRDAGFPAPIPCSGGRRYSRTAVLSWIDNPAGVAQAATEAAPGDHMAAEATLLARARAMMTAD